MKALKKLTLIAATSVTAFSLAITFYNSAALNNDSFMDARFASNNKRLDELNGDITIGRMAASTQSWDSLEVEKEAVKPVELRKKAKVASSLKTTPVELEPAIKEDLELTLASVKLGVKAEGKPNKLTALKEGSFSGSARTSNGYVEEVVVNLPNGKTIDIYSHKRMASNVFEYEDPETGELRSAMMYESAKNTFTVMLTNDTYYPGTRLEFKTSGETFGNDSNANWAMNDQNINNELAESEEVQNNYEQEEVQTDYAQDVNPSENTPSFSFQFNS